MPASEVQSVHVTRRLDASPERAFEAWVNPALLERWLAPIVEVDARFGGHFRLEIPKQEEVHVVTGEYREIVPGQRIVMTWVYDGPMGSAEKMEALLRVDIRRHGPTTEVELHHDHLTNPVYRDTIKRGAWTRALDELQNVLRPAA